MVCLHLIANRGCLFLFTRSSLSKLSAWSRACVLAKTSRRCKSKVLPVDKMCGETAVVILFVKVLHDFCVQECYYIIGSSSRSRLYGCG